MIFSNTIFFVIGASWICIFLFFVMSSDLSESPVGVPRLGFRPGLRHRCNRCENSITVEVFRPIKLVSCRSVLQIIEIIGLSRFCRSLAHTHRGLRPLRACMRAREGQAVWAALASGSATKSTSSGRPNQRVSSERAPHLMKFWPDEPRAAK